MLEQERKLREAAEAANRAKDEFLSVISHELRSPLNAILGWNRILTLKRRDDPEVASITPRIEHSAKAQLKMVNDLLDLGRVGTGKLKVDSDPRSWGRVVKLALDLARPAAAARGIELAMEVAAGAGQMSGDPDRLQQVVANLLSNAVKFSASGDRITVKLHDVEGFSELTVSDTGQGIATELLPHVFDRFRQGDSSSTRHSGGLGLGLTLVREIVVLHGGTVAASSGGADAGATFVVRLPTAPSWTIAQRHCGSSRPRQRAAESQRPLHPGSRRRNGCAHGRRGNPPTRGSPGHRLRIQPARLTNTCRPTARTSIFSSPTSGCRMRTVTHW